VYSKVGGFHGGEGSSPGHNPEDLNMKYKAASSYLSYMNSTIILWCTCMHTCVHLPVITF
jgi:hypothetical protein